MINKKTNNITEYAYPSGLVIKVGEHIDYKPPAEDKLTIGKIERFQKAPESTSMWMYISEIEDATNKDWISCEVWKEQKDSGLFENKQQLTVNLKEAKNDTRNEPEAVDDLPF